MNTNFNNFCIGDPELVCFTDRQGQERSFYRCNLLNMDSYETCSMTCKPELAKALVENPSWLHTPVTVCVEIRNFKGKWSLKIVDALIDGNSLLSLIR